MLGLILAVPLACALAAPPKAADERLQSKREAAAFFATLEIDQPMAKGMPMLGARLAAVFRRRFGLEASRSNFGFMTLTEASALAVIKLRGAPVLLKAGFSHVPGWDIGDHDFDGASGFHLGASLLSGEVDDRARFRLEYTYRRFGHREPGVSSVGVGLVLKLY